MDVSEKMMKLKKNLELPDFALPLHVSVCLKKKKKSHFNVLSKKLLLLKPSWFAWETISMVLEFE